MCCLYREHLDQIERNAPVRCLILCRVYLTQSENDSFSEEGEVFVTNGLNIVPVCTFATTVRNVGRPDGEYEVHSRVVTPPARHDDHMDDFSSQSLRRVIPPATELDHLNDEDRPLDTHVTAITTAGKEP